MDCCIELHKKQSEIYADIESYLRESSVESGDDIPDDVKDMLLFEKEYFTCLIECSHTFTSSWFLMSIAAILKSYLK